MKPSRSVPDLISGTRIDGTPRKLELSPATAVGYWPGRPRKAAGVSALPFGDPPPSPELFGLPALRPATHGDRSSNRLRGH